MALVSASEFAAAQIRKSILEGALEPGARIQQHALALELGVSHVPLREAIQKLEAEGNLRSAGDVGNQSAAGIDSGVDRRATADRP